MRYRAWSVASPVVRPSSARRAHDGVVRVRRTSSTAGHKGLVGLRRNHAVAAGSFGRSASVKETTEKNNSGAPSEMKSCRTATGQSRRARDRASELHERKCADCRLKRRDAVVCTQASGWRAVQPAGAKEE